MIGRTLSHYRIAAALGTGGMGEVYRATDTRLGREVALKVLPPEWASSPERLDRFRREAQALAALDHPGVVTVYSVEEADGVHFLTMQLIEGESLDRRIEAGGLPAAAVIETAEALAEALAVAHEKGIVHRDLKPANIMVTDDGKPKILDFGLAKIAPGEEAGSSETPTWLQTREGAVMGTLPYMSPEQVSGHPLDHRSDLFSLGVVLYEMAAGRRPFDGHSAAEFGSAILRDDPPSLAELRGDLPAALTRTIGRCLEKAPGDRWQNASELLAALRESEPSSTVPASTNRDRRSPPWTLIAIGLLALAGLLTVLVIGLRGSSRDSPAEEPPTAPLAEVNERPSIAVLPFVNLSGDEEQEYFSDGVAEEVLNALASVPGIRVAARSSAFSFKGRSVDVRTVGERLDVDHVVEGSVRRAGAQLRISAQLINAQDGYQLWSQTFDRELTDVFAVQEEIARAIVGELRGQLGVPTTSLVRPGTDDLEAYNAFLRGWYRLGTYSLEATRQSIRDFEQAVAIDPRFADAYGALAMAWANLNVWVSFEEVDRALADAADRALALDPGQPGALAGKAWHAVRKSWNWDAAEELYLRSLEREPRDVFALDFYAALQLCPTGRTEDAVALYREALETDPLNTLLAWDLAWVLMMDGREEDALAAVDEVLAVTPDYPWGLALRAWALAGTGRTDELASALERVPDDDDENALMMRSLAYHALGDSASVDRLTERLRRRAVQTPPARVFLAWTLIGTGRLEEGLTELEKAFDVGSFQVVFARTYLGRDPAVREHPRFRSLLERMRLDDASLREQGLDDVAPR